MVSCAHLSVALRVALGASTWPGKRGFTIRRSSPTQRRNGRAFASLTARGGGLPIGVKPEGLPVSTSRFRCLGRAVSYSKALCQSSYHWFEFLRRSADNHV